jgi:hypothetical protein
MLHNAGFSNRDWELAPQYTSPGLTWGAVVLDFASLGEIAKKEETVGSFRRTPDGTFAAAPLFIDDVPAAFYKVSTNYPEFTPNHNTTEQEMLVVVNGILKVAMNDGERSTESDASLTNVIYMGQVVELHERAVSMQAVGLVNPANCLALALYGAPDIKIEVGRIPYNRAA